VNNKHTLTSPCRKYKITLPEDDTLWENKDFLEMVDSLEEGLERLSEDNWYGMGEV